MEQETVLELIQE
jgi:hypothetical protein